MKTKLMAMLLMAGSTMFAGVRFGVGVGFGVPVPAPVVVNYMPPCPGPGYVFVNGVWTLPHYDGDDWARPRYESGRYVHAERGERHEVYGRGFRR